MQTVTGYNSVFLSTIDERSIIDYHDHDYDAIDCFQIRKLVLYSRNIISNWIITKIESLFILFMDYISVIRCEMKVSSISDEMNQYDYEIGLEEDFIQFYVV